MGTKATTSIELTPPSNQMINEDKDWTESSSKADTFITVASSKVVESFN